MSRRAHLRKPSRWQPNPRLRPPAARESAAQAARLLQAARARTLRAARAPAASTRGWALRQAACRAALAQALHAARQRAARPPPWRLTRASEQARACQVPRAAATSCPRSRARMQGRERSGRASSARHKRWERALRVSLVVRQVAFESKEPVQAACTTRIRGTATRLVVRTSVRPRAHAHSSAHSCLQRAQKFSRQKLVRLWKAAAGSPPA